MSSGRSNRSALPDWWNIPNDAEVVKYLVSCESWTNGNQNWIPLLVAINFRLCFPSLVLGSGRILGAGQFGQVSRIQSVPPNILVPFTEEIKPNVADLVVKFICASHRNRTEQDLVTFHRGETLGCCFPKEPTIIRCYLHLANTFQPDLFEILVMERCSGDLSGWIPFLPRWEALRVTRAARGRVLFQPDTAPRARLPLAAAQELAVQLIAGVAELTRRLVLHRDILLRNVMVKILHPKRDYTFQAWCEEYSQPLTPSSSPTSTSTSTSSSSSSVNVDSNAAINKSKHSSPSSSSSASSSLPMNPPVLLKLADFGMAIGLRDMPDDVPALHSSGRGARIAQPPPAVVSSLESQNAYALGIILHTLVTGIHPIDPLGDITSEPHYTRNQNEGYPSNDFLKALSRDDFPFKSADFSREFEAMELPHFFQGILCPDPHKRSTLAEMSRSKFIKSYTPRSLLMKGLHEKVLKLGQSQGLDFEPIGDGEMPPTLLANWHTPERNRRAVSDGILIARHFLANPQPPLVAPEATATSPTATAENGAAAAAKAGKSLTSAAAAAASIHHDDEFVGCSMHEMMMEYKHYYPVAIETPETSSTSASSPSSQPEESDLSAAATATAAGVTWMGGPRALTTSTVDNKAEETVTAVGEEAVDETDGEGDDEAKAADTTAYHVHTVLRKPFVGAPESFRIPMRVSSYRLAQLTKWDAWVLSHRYTVADSADAFVRRVAHAVALLRLARSIETLWFGACGLTPAVAVQYVACDMPKCPPRESTAEMAAELVDARLMTATPSAGQGGTSTTTMTTNARTNEGRGKGGGVLCMSSHQSLALLDTRLGCTFTSCSLSSLQQLYAAAVAVAITVEELWEQVLAARPDLQNIAQNPEKQLDEAGVLTRIVEYLTSSELKSGEDLLLEAAGAISLVRRVHREAADRMSAVQSIRIAALDAVARAKDARVKADLEAIKRRRAFLMQEDERLKRAIEQRKHDIEEANAKANRSNVESSKCASSSSSSPSSSSWLSWLFPSVTTSSSTTSPLPSPSPSPPPPPTSSHASVLHAPLSSLASSSASSSASKSSSSTSSAAICPPSSSLTTMELIIPPPPQAPSLTSKSSHASTSASTSSSSSRHRHRSHKNSSTSKHMRKLRLHTAPSTLLGPMGVGLLVAHSLCDVANVLCQELYERKCAVASSNPARRGISTVDPVDLQLGFRTDDVDRNMIACGIDFLHRYISDELQVLDSTRKTPTPEEIKNTHPEEQPTRHHHRHHRSRHGHHDLQHRDQQPQLQSSSTSSSERAGAEDDCAESIAAARSARLLLREWVEGFNARHLADFTISLWRHDIVMSAANPN